MPCARNVRATGLTSPAINTKSPVMAALPLPVGWKLIAVATPIAGSNSMPPSVIRSARENAVDDPAAPPERGFDLPLINGGPGGARARRGLTEGRAARSERRSDRLRELHDITVAAVVHVHHVW